MSKDEAVEELKKVIGKNIVDTEIFTSPADDYDEFKGFALVFDDGTSLEVMDLTCSKLYENRETCEELEITMVDHHTGEKSKSKCNATLGGGMLFTFDEGDEKVNNG